MERSAVFVLLLEKELIVVSLSYLSDWDLKLPVDSRVAGPEASFT